MIIEEKVEKLILELLGSFLLVKSFLQYWEHNIIETIIMDFMKASPLCLIEVLGLFLLFNPLS